MKIKESIKLHVPVTEVWDILKDPGNMPAWNHKCRSCDCNGGVGVGSSFQAMFELGSKGRKAFCEVVEWKPAEKITIRYSGEAFGSKGGYVDETFLLIHKGPRETRVNLVVDFSNSGLPIFFKGLMWFISKFGYKAGRSSLDGIKELVE